MKSSIIHLSPESERDKNVRGKAVRMIVTILVFVLSLTIFAGCRKSDSAVSISNDNSTSSQTARPTPRNQFERDLQYVRDFQLAHIYLFTRKDGGRIDQADITYLKQNTPSETNTWVVDPVDRKYAIAGTNFDFKPEHFDALNKRFNVEDYTGK